MLFIYLHTSQYVTQCGIYKLQMKTMGFHLGYTSSPVENALIGFCAAFPDFVAWDKETGEVALLQYPNLFLKDAPKKIWNYVIKELAGVQSMELLKKVIEKSSATTSKPYLSRLRSLNMEIQNAKRDNANTLLDIGLMQSVEDEQVISEKEKKRKEKKEKEKTPAPANEPQPLKTEQEEQQIIPAIEYELEAYKKAARFFCETYGELNKTWKNAAYALPYFQNKQKKGYWYELQIPATAEQRQRWIGQHLSGIDQWAAREHKFNPKKNGSTAQVSGGYRIPKVDFETEK